jgi:hypothetical protein
MRLIYYCQGATWYQNDIDAALPWIVFKGSQSAKTEVQAGIASRMIRGRGGPRLQNFVITFKPGESHGSLPTPSDDPIFGAHQKVADGYVADREVVVLACVEIFKICSKDHCVEPRTDEFYIWLSDSYPSIISVWLSLQLEASYGASDVSNGPLRRFLASGPNHRQRWQHDLEERFIKSMLRVCYASVFAGEQDHIDAIGVRSPYANANHP